MPDVALELLKIDSVRVNANNEALSAAVSKDIDVVNRMLETLCSY